LNRATNLGFSFGDRPLWRRNAVSAASRGHPKAFSHLDRFHSSRAPRADFPPYYRVPPAV